jgi:hypothetical protein
MSFLAGESLDHTTRTDSLCYGLGRRMTAAPTRWLSIALVTLGLVTTRPVSAHPEWSPLRVNRYVKLALDGDPRLIYTLLYGDGPALSLRKSVDRDANGKVDESEKAELGRRTAELVRVGLKLTIDGKEISLSPAATDVGLAGDEVAPAPLSVDLTYTLSALALPGTHRISIDDRVAVPSEGDNEIAVEDASGRLVASHRGAKPTDASAPIESRLFTFRGPRFSALEDRTVTIVVAAPTSTPPPSRRLWSWLGAAVLLVLAGVVWVTRRREPKRA